MPFNGLRVLSLESRRAAEMEKLIRNQGGEPFVAPSMREVALADNDPVFGFAERLFAGEFDMMILLTGVGTRALHQVLSERYGAEAFPAALRKLCVVVRGPKPSAVCRELQVPVTVQVPEPNTWRELLEALKDRPEKRIAVQEYGKPSHGLESELRARGAEVTAVRIYNWALPEDTGPLREAARRLAAGEVDVAMFTTSAQVQHLMQVAAEQGLDPREAVRRNTVVASIGPTCSEMLEEYGFQVDMQPTHPKMGFLVKEAADQAHALLERKR